MRLEDLDYSLPKKRIARYPIERREDARLLVVERKSGAIQHSHIHQLPNYLDHGDAIVINNTRVIPARLHCKSEERKFEVMLLEPIQGMRTWKCLVRPGKKVRGETEIQLSNGSSARIARLDDGFSIVFPEDQLQFFSWLRGVGEPPIPPYLDRPSETLDWRRYQTEYARADGAVAAPTAGLHLTIDLIRQLESNGCRVVETTLHVGYGTFAPLDGRVFSGNKLHAEFFDVPKDSLMAIEQAKTTGHRVLCVGTTALRAIESVPYFGRSGSTTLFIKPGFEFQYANALLTNFHLPRSSLLLLVHAFLGSEKTRQVYLGAIGQGYRFYSYGDAMLIGEDLGLAQK